VKHPLCAFAVAGMLLASGNAPAAEHRVQMLNKGPDGGMMVFEPAFLKVEPGDTVTFVPTDKSHNSETVRGMVPEGAEGWKGGVNQEVSVTLDTPGLYGYKCTPHYGLGMVGLIQVGEDPPNVEEARAVKHPGRAGTRMAALLEQVVARAPDGGPAASEVADAGAR
jgi:pseudoazurin